MSLAALKYGQHKKAYHAALEDQRYLKTGGLKVKILVRAFRKFPNLKKVTIDYGNSNIGSRQLIRDFGAFKAADLFSCAGANTVPSLIQALSEADVKLSDLKIGFDFDISTSCYTPNLFSSSDSGSSYPSSLCSNAMSIVFNDPENIIHPQRVLRQVRTLEITELSVKNDRLDLLKMAEAIKSLIRFTRELESVNIMKIGPENLLSSMERLSVEDLFCTSYSSSHLKVVKLQSLSITDHHTLVSFTKLHARSLEEVSFTLFDLEDVT